MKVEWTERAEWQRDNIANYIREQFGTKRRDKFVQEVDNTARMLMHNPNLGAIDPLFSDRPAAYRSVIINGLSKMVYRIDDDTIHIAAFWDTRSEPKAQAAKTE